MDQRLVEVPAPLVPEYSTWKTPEQQVQEAQQWHVQQLSTHEMMTERTRTELQ